MCLRLGLACLLFALQGSVSSITGESMRPHYGPPVSETFLVRPGVEVTASYGKNSQVCELFISTQKPTTPIKFADQTPNSIDSKLLTQVIDELVPESVRGRHISSRRFRYTGTAARMTSTMQQFNGTIRTAQANPRNNKPPARLVFCSVKPIPGRQVG
jgi:hypothetical protein